MGHALPLPSACPPAPGLTGCQHTWRKERQPGPACPRPQGQYFSRVLPVQLSQQQHLLFCRAAQVVAVGVAGHPQKGAGPSPPSMGVRKEIPVSPCCLAPLAPGTPHMSLHCLPLSRLALRGASVPPAADSAGEDPGCGDTGEAGGSWRMSHHQSFRGVTGWGDPVPFTLLLADPHHPTHPPFIVVLTRGHQRGASSSSLRGLTPWPRQSPRMCVWTRSEDRGRRAGSGICPEPSECLVETGVQESPPIYSWGN